MKSLCDFRGDRRVSSTGGRKSPPPDRPGKPGHLKAPVTGSPDPDLKRFSVSIVKSDGVAATEGWSHRDRSFARVSALGGGFAAPAFFGTARAITQTRVDRNRGGIICRPFDGCRFSRLPHRKSRSTVDESCEVRPAPTPYRTHEPTTGIPRTTADDPSGFGRMESTHHSTQRTFPSDAPFIRRGHPSDKRFRPPRVSVRPAHPKDGAVRLLAAVDQDFVDLAVPDGDRVVGTASQQVARRGRPRSPAL